MTAPTETELEKKAADAVLKALDTDEWLTSPLAIYFWKKGVAGLEKRAMQQSEPEPEPEQESAKRVEVGDDLDAEGWTSDIAYAWRLGLQGVDAPCVVYFQSEPDYSTVKAFARAAGVPAVNAKAERRPDGE